MRETPTPVYSVAMAISGVSSAITVTDTGRNAVMAQPHKGERRLVGTRLARDVHDEVQRRAADAGTSVSQYVADVLAAHVGRTDEIRETPADALFPRHQLEEPPLADIA